MGLVATGSGTGAGGGGGEEGRGAAVVIGTLAWGAAREDGPFTGDATGRF
jgi:hypothetical protein